MGDRTEPLNPAMPSGPRGAADGYALRGAAPACQPLHPGQGPCSSDAGTWLSLLRPARGVLRAALSLGAGQSGAQNSRGWIQETLVCRHGPVRRCAESGESMYDATVKGNIQE